MQLSIIIPVYNVEKYIGRCLESLVTQLVEGCEVIIINDGSKDSSGDILDSYAEKYSQIQVFHIPNGGVSNARNLALEKACGEFVWFIDSDDYVEETAVQRVLGAIEKYQTADLFIYDAIVVNEKNERTKDLTCNVACGKPLESTSNRELILANTSLWNRIYRRDVITKEGLMFETNITIAEDLLFNYQYLLACRNIYYLNETVYFYVERKNSAMSGAGKNRDVQKVFEILLEYYKEKGVYQTFQEEIEYLVIYHYFLVTSVRILRCGLGREECSKVQDWFQQQNIRVSFKNSYVGNMKKSHKLLIVLLKLRCYKLISMMFKRF